MTTGRINQISIVCDGDTHKESMAHTKSVAFSSCGTHIDDHVLDVYFIRFQSVRVRTTIPSHTHSTPRSNKQLRPKTPVPAYPHYREGRAMREQAGWYIRWLLTSFVAEIPQNAATIKYRFLFNQVSAANTRQHTPSSARTETSMPC